MNPWKFIFAVLLALNVLFAVIDFSSGNIGFGLFSSAVAVVMMYFYARESYLG